MASMAKMKMGEKSKQGTQLNRVRHLKAVIQSLGPMGSYLGFLSRGAA